MAIASLLPNGKQQFFDSNGNPLSGGSVYFYIPSTSTPKNTWQDPGMSILNTNPVVLDAAGEAIIYGSGQYRQKVYDSSNNLIWDQLTADVSYSVTQQFGRINIVTFTSNGTYVPSANFLGCIVEGVGAGGGSGGVNASANVTSGGGSAGSYAKSYFTASTVGSLQTITIGAGGAPGSGTGPTAGGAGGTSSFGTLLITVGGLGSNAGSSGTTGVTTPSTGSTGQFIINGQAGGPTFGTSSTGGIGGDSFLGTGGYGGVNGAGSAGQGYGGGGGGCSSGASGVAQNGVTGSQGVIIITEYLSS